MTITNIVIAPSSCGHLEVSGLVNGNPMTVSFYRDELALEPEDAKEAFIARMRSFAKENGYTTVAQVRTNVVGKTFQI